MRDSRITYQIFVIIALVVLLTVGIFIGLKLTGKDDGELRDDIVQVDNKEKVEVYTEPKEEEKEVSDIEIIYVDIYEGCNHKSEVRNNEYGMNFDEVKQRELEKIVSNGSGYKMVKDNDGILMFEKTNNCKCDHHYLLKIEGDKVIIYKYSSENETGYEKYEETEIIIDRIRPDIKYQLETGIEAETLEELYMLLEEMES